MTEPAFREIQLTKKQLVFLFMASVVLAAVVFLLGVSLGRRLPTSTLAAGPVAPADDEVAPAEMPPPTVLTADDQKYATELQGSGVVPPASPVPPPVAPATSARAEAPAAQAPAAAQTPPVTTTSKPAEPPAQAASEAKPAQGGWFLQVNAFRSRSNAESEVARLKSRGHAAFVSPSGSLFRVRVGPFPDRADAEAASGKLKQDGFRPSITR